MKVFVLEDEFIIADEIESILVEGGHDVLGPIATIDEAVAELDRITPDFAIIDANIRGSSSAPVIDRLRQKGVPFCVCTGYRKDEISALFGPVPTLQKPIVPGALTALIDQLTAGDKARSAPG